MDDADTDNADPVDVPAAEEVIDEDASWPVLSDLDLAVCLSDNAPTDARSRFRRRETT